MQEKKEHTYRGHIHTEDTTSHGGKKKEKKKRKKKEEVPSTVIELANFDWIV